MNFEFGQSIFLAHGLEMSGRSRMMAVGTSGPTSRRSSPRKCFDFGTLRAKLPSYVSLTRQFGLRNGGLSVLGGFVEPAPEKAEESIGPLQNDFPCRCPGRGDQGFLLRGQIPTDVPRISQSSPPRCSALVEWTIWP